MDYQWIIDYLQCSQI